MGKINLNIIWLWEHNYPWSVCSVQGIGDSLLVLCVSGCPSFPTPLTPMGIPPLFWRAFELLPLPLGCTPHPLAVLLHPLEVTVTNQLHEFFIPELSGGRGRWKAWEGAERRMQLAFTLVVVPSVEQTLQSVLFQHLQSHPGYGLDKAMLHRLAQVHPGVRLLCGQKQQTIRRLNNVIIAFYLSKGRTNWVILLEWEFWMWLIY